MAGRAADPGWEVTTSMDDTVPFQRTGRSPALGASAMAATSDPRATLAALDMLRRGGSAVDAGVAAAFVLNIAEPAMTSLGGDMFALFAPPGAGRADVVALNGSGRAPKNIDVAAARARHGQTLDVGHADAVTIPGAVSGLLALHARYGVLPLDVVLEPGLAAAQDGLPVAPRSAWDWARFEGRLQGAARSHLLPNGRAPKVGERAPAPGQATVLRRLMAHGRDGFYEGPVAEDMTASLRAAGGAHTLEDFADVQPEWTRPFANDYRGKTLLTAPPNSQGVIAALILAVLERFNLADMDPLSPKRAHLEAEAVAIAYDARDRWLSDPVSAPLTPERMIDAAGGLADLIDARAAQGRNALAARADAVWRDVAGAAGAPQPIAHGDTVYLSVVDGAGAALSLIVSIFHGFGSGLASDRYGILFQSRGAGFVLTPGHPNQLTPGLRPLHTLIPAMLFDGDRLMCCFGVMGGQYQANGVARFVSNRLDYGMSAQEALDAPRSFAERLRSQSPSDGNGDVVDRLAVEAGYADSARAALSDLGHPAVQASAPIGGGQAIDVDWEVGALIGASDPRKDGCALGV